MVRFNIDVAINTRNAQAQVAGVGTRLNTLNANAGRLRSTLLSAFGAIGVGLGGGAAIRTIANFEQSMSTLRAVTGATEDQFSALNEEAQRLGATTRFSASEASDALVSLARAGFSVDESLTAVSQVLTLAQSGGIGLAQAADIAAATLRGFRLEATESARVVDVLTLAANSANTTVSQLGEGLKFVAPVAAGLGVPLERTSAALATLSDSGLQASLAGTGLRRVLAELEAPSTTTQAILRDLGLATDEVKISQVGLVGALEALSKQGIDTGQALQIFGQRGGPAFEVLVSNIPRVKELTKELENSGGNAARVARIMDDNLNGALLQVRSSFEAFVLALGDTAGATGSIEASLEGVADTLRFLAENAETVGVVLEGVAIVAGVRLAQVAIPALIGQLTRLNVVASANPFGALIAAGGAAVAVFAQLRSDARDTAAEFGKLAAVSGEVGANLERAVLAGAAETLGLPVLPGLGQSVTQDVEGNVGLVAAALARLRKATEEAEVAAGGLTAEQEKQAKAFQAQISVLDAQAKALAITTKETEAQARAAEIVQKLIGSGGSVSPGQRAQLESRLELIESLKDQAAALAAIKGPQEDAARAEAALNALLAQGKIESDEFNTALADLRSELGSAGDADPFTEQLKSLQDSNAVLQTRLERTEEEANLLELVLGLRAQGVELDVTKLANLAEQVALQQRLTEAEQARRDAQRDEDRNARRAEAAERNAARQQERLLDQVNVQRQLIDQRNELNALLEVAPGLQDEIALALEDVALRSLEASDAAEAGFERAFIKINQEARDLASVMEGIVNSFVDNTANALDEFAETGKFRFRDFADSVLDDLRRILIRLLIVQAISATLGGGGGAGLGNVAFGGGRQRGGTTQPGQAFLVGEREPELFNPGQTGSVTPLSQLEGGGQPPQVNILIVNEMDRDMVKNQVAAGEFDEVLINRIGENKNKVKAAQS